MTELEGPPDTADEITFERLSGNRTIEAAAILWVMELERAAGRQPTDKRNDSAYPADLDSPPRVIEVKAVGGDARGADLPLEVRQVERAKSEPNFYLYLVDRVAQGNPAAFRLKVFAGPQLARLMLNMRERRFFELPVPVKEFDAAPGAEAISDSAARD